MRWLNLDLKNNIQMLLKKNKGKI